MSAGDLLRRLDGAERGCGRVMQPRHVYDGRVCGDVGICMGCQRTAKRLRPILRTLLPELRAVVEEARPLAAQARKGADPLRLFAERVTIALDALDARAAELLAERDAELCSEGGTDG